MPYMILDVERRNNKTVFAVENKAIIDKMLKASLPKALAATSAKGDPDFAKILQSTTLTAEIETKT